MSNAPIPTHPLDAGDTAHRFFAVQELLGTPELARFYTDLLVNSPTTITAARDRQEFSKSTAYKYANTLAELGVATELDTHEDGSALWRADPVSELDGRDDHQTQPGHHRRLWGDQRQRRSRPVHRPSREGRTRSRSHGDDRLPAR
jgi:hypothetical protein